MKKEVIRQGDVYLFPGAKVPKGAKPVPTEGGRTILAHGELTGHAHAIADEGVALMEDEKGGRVLDVPREAQLDHEDHGVVPIPAGTYEVRRQREWLPEEIRYVAD